MAEYVSVGITLANMILFAIFMIYAITNLVKEIKRGIRLNRKLKKLNQKTKWKQSL